uniref:Si:dkey-283j8.1 n=1 Tax=Cyprinus carpio TaxID=7962 RepID=A0A8C1JGT1_CYPCA
MTNAQETTRRDASPSHAAADAVRMRRRKAQGLVSGMLSLSLLIVVMGIYTSTRTESVSITGYMSGIVLAFGSFLGVLGLCLEENRKQLLIAAIVFLSFGIISSFLCLVVDGIFILLNIDMRPMKAGRCQFYTSGNSYIYENYYATVPCQGLTESCNMKVRSGTCYCCDLYDCANGGYLNNYYEFVGVQSCQEVLSLYVLLWVLTTLNLLAFVCGILTTAVLGSIKDMKSGVVGLDVSQLGGSSLFSFDGASCSSPTAPLLMDPNSHAGHQLYPRASLYVSPAGSSVSPAAAGSADTSHAQPNPPPFAPLYNLLPYKTSSFSA